MRIRFASLALADYRYWRETSPKLRQRVDDLLRDIARDHFRGIGKPEPLRGNLSGWWSRRIDREHRLVYRVEDDEIIVLQCRFHYER